jgi:hypothetical protein
VAVGGDDPVQALVATGWTQAAALALVLGRLGPEAVVPHLVRFLHRPSGGWRGFTRILALLDAWAKEDPELARMGLRVCLEGRPVTGNVVLVDRLWVDTLPVDLRIDGDLILRGVAIATLPEHLVVTGDLVLADLPLTCLPDDLQLGGSLTLDGVGVSALPKGLAFKRNLVLDGVDLKLLPDGLTVRGNLELRRCPLRTLPKGLRVGGRLAIEACPAWNGQLPDDARARWVQSNPRQEALTPRAWRRRNPRGELSSRSPFASLLQDRASRRRM